MSDLTSEQSAFGVVTFLDVLGWKGVWTRLAFGEPISKLREIEVAASNDPVGITVEPFGVFAEVFVLSDTIVITSKIPREGFGSVNLIVKTLEEHGHRCASAIVTSLRLGLPIRGATTYGQYQMADKSFYGPAIDEAASWHESCDWSGVTMSPSAELEHLASEGSIWIPIESPFKTGKRKCHAVDWWKYWLPESDDNHRLAELKNSIKQNSPFVPEIWHKYENTLSFAANRISSVFTTQPSAVSPAEKI